GAELLAYPLAAATGASLGVLFARGRRAPAVVAGVAALVAMPIGMILSLPGVAHPIPYTVGLLLPPAAAIASPVHAAHDEGPAFTVIMLAGYLAWAVATWAYARAVQRRQMVLRRGGR